MDSQSSKYQSRALREVHNKTDRPFSPPSSTGSHGTFTLTSQISLPANESSRAQPTLPALNTSVLRRQFPEWEAKNKSYNNKNHIQEKENKVPAPPPPAIEDDTSMFGPNSPKLRAQQSVPAANDTMDGPHASVTTLLDTLKHSRPDEASKQSPAFTANAARRIHRQSQNNNNNNNLPSTSANAANQTVGSFSFFVPHLNHLNDFVSGTLRWSTFKNGTPVFVKHGKVHDSDTKASLDHHPDFEAMSIPTEEEKIFVSLDKIREEIQTLQEHDEYVSKQAEQLQDEVSALHSQVTKLKSRKDSAMGSDSDGSVVLQLTSQKTHLEEQVASLRTRLDQANRQISLNEIHNESFVTERDEALQKASDHIMNIKRLQARNESITAQKVELQQALKESEDELDSERALLENLHRKYDQVVAEKNMLKQDNLSLERHNETLIGNHRAAQSKNSQLQKDNKELQEKVAQLENLVDGLNQQLAQKTEVRQHTRESKVSNPGMGKSKLTKVAHRESRDRHTVVSEMSAATSTSPLDLPQQDNLTFETDFTRSSLGQLTQESKGSIPARTRSRLTKMAHRGPGDRHTVVSEMSAKTTTSQTDMQMQDDYTQQIDFTQEGQGDSDQENMTSALFIDDITLDSKKSARKQKTKATPAVRVLSPILSVTEEETSAGKKASKPAVLTQSARRVLDNLCSEHECTNCVLCSRIKSTPRDATGRQSKKTVRVERPATASERVQRHRASSRSAYEDQPTMRPSQNPAVALAKVMKALKDEEQHLGTLMARKQLVYDECDPAINKRLWKQVDGEIKGLRKRRDLKRDQIYDLQDVLEGQKANAQLMSQEAVDMTITSVLSRDPTWNGIMDY